MIRDDGKICGVFELSLVGANKHGHALLSKVVHVHDDGQGADVDIVADATAFQLKDRFSGVKNKGLFVGRLHALKGRAWRIGIRCPTLGSTILPGPARDRGRTTAGRLVARAAAGTTDGKAVGAGSEGTAGKVCRYCAIAITRKPEGHVERTCSEAPLTEDIDQ